MSANHIFQSGKWQAVLASLALPALLLILSLVLNLSLAHAQTGSISGTVTYYGGIPGPHQIGIAAHPDPGESPVAGTTVPSPGGSYTISGLDDGTYYVSALLDANDSGGPPDDGEPLAWYDPDGDGNPDPVVITGEGAVTGIDIALGGPWLPLGGPIAEGGQVNGLAVHPAISDTVYAAVAPEEAYDTGPSVIYKTTDGAANWTPVYTAEHQVYALAVTGTNVYAGSFNRNDEGPAIYVSHDSGVSWTPAFSLTDRGVLFDIAMHPTDPDVAIIGGWGYHELGQDEVQSGLLYGTDDAGLTWTPILTVTFPDSEGSITAVLIHPVTPTLLLAAAHADNSEDGIVYRSQDGGVTWPVSVTVPNAQFMSFAVHATDPQMIYAGTTNARFSRGPSRVFRSTDAGLSWTEVFADAGGRLVFKSPHTVYGVTKSGRVSRSASDGDPGTWSEIGHSGGGLSFDIDLGATPATLYAGTREGGVSKSTDGGFNWEYRNNGIEYAVQPVDIDVDPDKLDKMFVAAEGGGGWMTTDGGNTWTQPFYISGEMGAFAINPEDPNIVYGGGYDDRSGAVMRSEDGGFTFERVYTATFILADGSGGGEQIHALAIAPSMSSTVYAAGLDNPNWEDDQAVIVRSLNDGASWTEVFTLPAESRVETMAINPADDDIVYAGGEDCSGPDCVGFVYRTTDGGETWNPTLVATGTVSSIVIDHWNPNVVYVGDRGYWIRKSTDGGDTWSVVREAPWVSGEPSGYLLAIDPNVPSHVYLGGWDYIAESTDAGQTWSEWDATINQGTPEMEPSALTVGNGTVTQTLYAGFTGVWYYSRLAPQPSRIHLPLALKNF